MLDGHESFDHIQDFAPEDLDFFEFDGWLASSIHVKKSASIRVLEYDSIGCTVPSNPMKAPKVLQDVLARPCVPDCGKSFDFVAVDPIGVRRV